MRIEDYALIGNFETSALVSKEGSIDWLCLPRFDSGACFSALLGNSDNGRWLIQPQCEFKISRSYRKNTMILETVFSTSYGEFKLIDCMIPGVETPVLVRLVKGLTGTIPVFMELCIRFDYGSIIPWVTQVPAGGIVATAGPDTLWLNTKETLEGKNFKTFSCFEIKAGQVSEFVLSWSPSHRSVAPRMDRPEVEIEKTQRFWNRWMSQCNYEGSYPDAFNRSLMTLKALTYHPTGGIVAAPTTSLPEKKGGVRNWDYRFCWLRDSAMTLFSLLNAGYVEEAERWRDWLLRAVAGKGEQLNVMYGVAGERRLTEMELPWLEGFANSKPVRIGNAAYGQLQLDIFGEVLNAFHLSRQHGIRDNAISWDIQREIISYLEEVWDKADNGIWEIRGEKQHFTLSKVSAWFALERAITAVERFGLPGPKERWKKLATQIHEEVCDRAFNSSLGCFTQSFGSKVIDSSALMVCLMGLLPIHDPRIEGTISKIQEHLSVGGFLRRYRTDEMNDDLPPGEGVFIPCTLWLANCLILQGKRKEAIETLDRVLSIRNDVGLLSEEYDPFEKCLLGNFPQAFSHTALLGTLFYLR